MVFPVVLGAGKRLFADGTPRTVLLASRRQAGRPGRRRDPHVRAEAVVGPGQQDARAAA
jgi:hypothetical protein